jgi:Fur family ferric uptake transcriptional regulator
MYYQNKILKIKKTPTRDALYSILSHSDSPLSAEQLFTTLSGKNKKKTKIIKETKATAKNTAKTPDLVTIYRTLETFKLAHIVREVTFKDRTARYELIDEHGGHCHHAVCNSCGTTEHIDDPAIEEALHTLAKKFKHIKKVDEHVLEFFGVCKSCDTLDGKKK